MADIQGPKAQSGGRTGEPNRERYSDMMLSGVPEKRVISQFSGSSAMISSSRKSKTVTSQVSA